MPISGSETCPRPREPHRPSGRATSCHQPRRRDAVTKPFGALRLNRQVLGSSPRRRTHENRSPGAGSRRLRGTPDPGPGTVIPRLCPNCALARRPRSLPSQQDQAGREVRATWRPQGGDGHAAAPGASPPRQALHRARRPRSRRRGQADPPKPKIQHEARGAGLARAAALPLRGVDLPVADPRDVNLRTSPPRLAVVWQLDKWSQIAAPRSPTSPRTIPLRKEAVSELVRWRESQESWADRLGEHFANEPGLVLTTRTGRPA
jgi:hypothetical protein